MSASHAVTQPSAALMEVREAPGVYADALLRDERGGLLFISLWGRDTALQELQARLSLSVSEGGVNLLHVTRADDDESRVNLDRIQCMEKHSGRLPTRNLFGDVAQLWIYDRLATEPDRANRTGLLFLRGDSRSEPSEQDRRRIWQLVREVSHLPLLPHWQAPVLDVLDARGWLRRLDDGLGVQAWRVELGDPAFEGAISQLMHAGTLCLEPDATPAVAESRRKAA